MLEQTGIDGVTVARGAIGNPWIFQQSRALLAGESLPAPPTVHEQREVLSEHFRLAHQLYEDRCGPQMRKFGIKYSHLHPSGTLVRDAFVKVRNLEEWEGVLSRYYAEDAPGCHPPSHVHGGQSSCEAA